MVLRNEDVPPKTLPIADAGVVPSTVEERERLAAEEAKRKTTGTSAPDKPWPDFAPPRAPGVEIDRKQR